jgi:hypothetical protein
MPKSFQRSCFLVFLALLTSACSAGTSAPSEKDAAYTALVMTLSAPAVDNAGVPSASPTASPSPEISATLLPTGTLARTATRPPVPAGPLCDDSAYVGDVSIPDGTVMKPGEEFIKTWSIRNTGTCDWTTAYTLALASGSPMDGSTTYLPHDVKAGDTIEISVGLVAPATAGTHTSRWRLKNADGNFFGEWVSVQSVVSGSATTPANTSLPTPEITNTLEPTAESTSA